MTPTYSIEFDIPVAEHTVVRVTGYRHVPDAEGLWNEWRIGPEFELRLRTGDEVYVTILPRVTALDLMSAELNATSIEEARRMVDERAGEIAKEKDRDRKEAA